MKANAANLEKATVTLDIPQACPNVDAFDSEGKPRKQSEILIDIGRTHELFHSPERTAYARAGSAVHVIESSNYREVLAERFLDIASRGANRNSIQDAVTTLSSLAKFRGECRRVWVRIASGDANDANDGHSPQLHSIYIDMGRPDWRMIDVDSEGWRWCEVAPMFRRPGGIMALPEPATPDFGRIWRYLNVTDEHKPLIAAFVLASFRPSGPYLILDLNGEQGTGKSTAGRVIRRLIDPSASPLRAPPKDVRDLLVGALNGWVLALDNLSYLGPQISDALCRLSTGGAISERALYSNTDEVLIEVQRPCIINGIQELAVRPDLAERCLHIELDVIRNRIPESTFWRDFDADAPHIFAGILAGLSAAIRDHDRITIQPLPRMADFALWAAAGIGELGFTKDEFLAAYSENLNTGMGAGVDGSPAGRALLAFIQDRNQWSGTSAELLAEINHRVKESVRKSTVWPKSPRALSGAIKRLAPALRLHGIDVSYGRTGRARLLTLCNRPEQPSQPSLATLTSTLSDANDANDRHSPQLHDDAEVF